MMDFRKLKAEKPTNVHLSREYDAHLPDNVRLHPVSPDVTCIADGIDAVLDNFNATIIQAPTGFGKTYFILHEVLPKVVQSGGKMLLVSNRVAVSYQQKLQVMKIVDPSEIGCLTPEGVLKKTDFGPVKIMTLQALDLFLSTAQGREYAKEVSVFVVDEVHYFVADVSFNPSAARLLKVIPKFFIEATRIYMTATLEDALRPVAEAEASAERPMVERTGARFSPLMLGQSPVVNVYQFTSDRYSQLSVRYYKKDDDLYREIKESGEDKWLIFVPSKEDGATLQETIGDDAVFISADSKGNDAWNQLLDEERLPCRVLITTSVLDCGVNIHDENLKHVVIPFEDRTMFMQALGRVRFKRSPQFTLYVKAISQKRLNGLLYRNRELLSCAAEIQQHRYYNSYVDRFRLEGDRVKGALLYLDYDGRYKFNYLLYHKLLRQERYYKELETAIDQYGDAAFPRIVHSWLGQPDTYNDRNWLGYGITKQAQQDLLEFLRECDGKLLATEADQRAFSKKVHQWYQVITGDKKRDDRGGGYLKTAALNDCLEKLEINGTVKSNGKSGGWIFSMAEDKK
ncbi:MAG TPA: DEAD/DEAH box helicase family protein [Firmicutes bacterium]|nr:DEAD/DEAH box helicase family protein [Bacillota bacterium]